MAGRISRKPLGLVPNEHDLVEKAALLAENPGFRTHLGKVGREYAFANFSKERYMELLQKFFRKC